MKLIWIAVLSVSNVLLVVVQSPSQFVCSDVRMGDIDAVREKLRTGKIGVNRRAASGRTPLMQVMMPLEWQPDERDAFKQIFYEFATREDVRWDVTDALDNSMVHYAMRITDEEVIRYILDHVPAELIYQRNRAGKTPGELAEMLHNTTAHRLWQEYKIYHDVYLCMKHRRLYGRQ